MSTTVRREPPPFRLVSLVRRAWLSPRLIRVTLGGSDLAGFAVEHPAASVRLLLPSPGAGELVLPVWNGNEFLLADNTRPIIRTFTPRRFDSDGLELELDLVVHDEGAASGWAVEAPIGAAAAVSGPGRGYIVDPSVPGYVLIGDETAIPAISQLLEAISPTVPVQVHIELADPDAQILLPPHPLASVAWHTLPAGRPAGENLIGAVKRAEFAPPAKLWCAGEAAAMHAVRRHVFNERAIPRDRATIRGYWKARS